MFAIFLALTTIASALTAGCSHVSKVMINQQPSAIPFKAYFSPSIAKITVAQTFKLDGAGSDFLNWWSLALRRNPDCARNYAARIIFSKAITGQYEVDYGNISKRLWRPGVDYKPPLGYKVTSHEVILGGRPGDIISAFNPKNGQTLIVDLPFQAGDRPVELAKVSGEATIDVANSAFETNDVELSLFVEPLHSGEHEYVMLKWMRPITGGFP